MNTTTNKKRQFPSSFFIIILLMILFIIASWIGTYIDPNKITGIGILDVFSSLWRGFVSKIQVIIFCFSIGGTLGVMAKIKAVDAGISKMVNKLGNRTLLLIPILMIIFGFGGTTYGMWEDTIIFIPVLVPVFKKTGYGTFTGILVILLGAGSGVLASTINPFAVGAAVAAAKDVPNAVISLGSLQGTRWISFAILEIISITMVVWMATRYKKGITNNFKTDKEAVVSEANKGKNVFVSFFTRARVVEGLNEELIETRFKKHEHIEFTFKRKISLLLFVSSFLLMIIMYLPWADFLGWENFEGVVPESVKSYDKNMWWFASTNDKSGFAKIWDGTSGWWFISASAVFLFFTVIIFIINFQEFKSEKENAEQGFLKTYIKGAKDITEVAFLIATAAGLGQILEATKYGKLIAEESARGLNNWITFGVVVFFVSIFLSLLVPSTSGFAAAFIPIFARIAVEAFPNDVETAIGIAILGFIFSNGLANFVTPTSATLMGYTQYAGVPYNVWLKQVWKFVLIMFLISLFLIIGFSAAAAAGYSLF